MILRILYLHIFHLLFPTENQLSNSHHVRIHTNSAIGEVEKFDTEHKSQFDANLQSPQAIQEILEKSTEPYSSGCKELADFCVHYHTVDDNIYDYWDFKFPHPDYNESAT